jgi:hypothetical protein
VGGQQQQPTILFPLAMRSMHRRTPLAGIASLSRLR